MKTCTKCREERPSEAFPRDSSRRDGRHPYCKECRYLAERSSPEQVEKKREYQRKYNAANRDRIRAYFRMRDHGIAEVPDGPCAICGTVGRLAVDHDHSCCPGARSCEKCRRGLLCLNCNTALGHFEDNVGLLEVAIAYLLNPPGVAL